MLKLREHQKSVYVFTFVVVVKEINKICGDFAILVLKSIETFNNDYENMAH